jgi:hypothetical protein
MKKTKELIMLDDPEGHHVIGYSVTLIMKSWLTKE